MIATPRLHDLGQSIWLDNITRPVVRADTRFHRDGASNAIPTEIAIRASASCYRIWASRLSRTMRQAHVGGDKLFIDYAVPAVANAVRLQLHVLANNLGNFLRTLAMPRATQPWSLTSLREKLIKIGVKVVSHGRYVWLQVAEVAVPRQMFAEILSLIGRLRAPPAPA